MQLHAYKQKNFVFHLKELLKNRNIKFDHFSFVTTCTK